MSRGILSIETILLLSERRHGIMERCVLSLQGQKCHSGNIGQKWKGQDAEEVSDGGAVYEIGAMDRRDLQLATDGLGVGCNR